MNSDEILKLLSATAKDDLLTVAQWVNPLPKDAKTLLGKVEMALKMVSYSHNRQGSPAPSQTSIEQLAALKRLKSEIILLTKS
jgi:hypothetical protein